MGKRKDSSKPERNSPTARELLKSLTDRIVRLENEKKEIAGDIKDIYAEAKGHGFDPKSLRNVVRDLLKTEPQRAAQRETEAITDVYRAALGLLDGRGISDSARDRLDHPPRDDSQDDGDADADPDAGNDAGDAGPGDASDEAGREPPAPAPDTIEIAQQKGRDAHAAGEKVTGNPYLAGTPQRGAWDEGWCEAAGSDGMDIPAAWRRSGGGKKGP